MIKWNEVTWYSKLLAVLLFIFVLPTWTFYLGNEYGETNQTQSSTIEVGRENKNSLNEDALTPPEIKRFSNLEPITYTSPNGLKIIFKGIVTEARNPGSNLYIDDKMIGIVEGQGLIESSLSLNNRYFSFQILNVCGAICSRSMLYIVDLDDKTLIPFHKWDSANNK